MTDEKERRRGVEKSDKDEIIKMANQLISNLNNDQLMSAYINANHIFKASKKITPKMCDKETYCSTCKHRQKKHIFNFLVHDRELKCFHQNSISSYTDKFDGKIRSWYEGCSTMMPDNGLCGLWEEK